MCSGCRQWVSDMQTIRMGGEPGVGGMRRLLRAKSTILTRDLTGWINIVCSSGGGSKGVFGASKEVIVAELAA